MKERAHWRGRVWRNGISEEWRFDEQSLVGCELGCILARADVQGYDWGFEVAMDVRKLQAN